jgi:hypothetical protein
LKTLSFGYDREGIDAAIQLPPSLTCVNCNHGGSFPFAMLVTLPNLTEVSVRYDAVTVGRLQDLSRCTKLESLSLLSDEDRSTHVKHPLDLRPLVNLQRCVLVRCCTTLDVTGLPKLRWLTVDGDCLVSGLSR